MLIAVSPVLAAGRLVIANKSDLVRLRILALMEGSRANSRKVLSQTVPTSRSAVEKEILRRTPRITGAHNEALSW